MAEVMKFENNEQRKGYLMAVNDLKDLLTMLEKKFIEECLEKKE
jgi:hypothetical protein